MDHRQYLLQKIKAQTTDNDDARPVVSLEDFFVGNADYGSIGPNLTRSPGPQGFFTILRSIRDRDSVQDVLVGISEVVEEDLATWPFSDRVHVLSSSPIETVRAWLAPLEPDELVEGWSNDKPEAAPALKLGFTVYTAWWD